MYGLLNLYTFIMIILTGNSDIGKLECEKKFQCSFSTEKECLKEELNFRMERCLTRK